MYLKIIDYVSIFDSFIMSFNTPLGRPALSFGKSGDGQRPRECASENWVLVMKLLNDFFADETGATAIEYGFIALLVSLAMVAGATQVGIELNNVFGDVTPELQKR